MKPVFTADDITHYVSESDFIKFIDQNFDYDWNSICNLLRDEGVAGSEGKVYWKKGDIEKNPQYYNPIQTEWVTAFFTAHPFIKKFMLCFDD